MPRPERCTDTIYIWIYVLRYILEVYICGSRNRIEGALKERNQGKILQGILLYELNYPHEVEIQQPNLSQ